MSYQNTVKAIQALKDNTDYFISQEVGSFTDAIKRYGYSSRENLDYLCKNTNTVTELLNTGKQEYIELARYMGAGKDFLGAVLGYTVQQGVNVGMVTKATLEDTYTMLGSIAAYFGFRLTNENYQLNKEAYDQLFTDCIKEGKLFMLPNGNYYYDNATMSMLYDAYAEIYAGNGAAWSVTTGNRMKGTITNSFHLIVHGISSYELDVDMTLNVSGAKFFITEEGASDPNDRFTYGLYIIGDSHATPTITGIRTYYKDGLIFRPSDPNWGQVNLNFTLPETADANKSIIHITVDNEEYFYSNKINGPYNNDGSVSNLWAAVKDSNAPDGHAYARINPPYDGATYGYLPNISRINPYTGTFRSSKDSLEPVAGVNQPSIGGDITTTYPTWYSKTINRNINVDGDTYISNQYYYPVLPLSGDTINNINNTTINNLHGDTYTIIEKTTIINNTYIEETEDEGEKESDDNNDGQNPSAPSQNDQGSTDLPPSIIPSVSSNDTGFVAVYHPDKATVRSFSNWLWSIGFDLDTFKKLFQDPMQAIISLHQIFFTPTNATGSPANIRLGFIDTGISSDYVDDTSFTLDCGSIFVPEMYKNALDYSPAASAELYLPFIGFRKVNVNDMMGNTVNVTYNIDIITGACVAFVTVNRGSYQAILYTFSGNCAVELPISSANFNQIIGNVIGIAASVGAAAATGGITAPLALSAAASAATNSQINIEHGGSLTGNVGALSGKKPYLIVTRPKNKTAMNYQHFIGYPANSNITLNQCSGYTRVKDIILDSIQATADEKNELEALLKRGVIL